MCFSKPKTSTIKPSNHQISLIDSDEENLKINKNIFDKKGK